MSIRGLLFQRASTIKMQLSVLVQYKDHHFIKLTCSLSLSLSLSLSHTHTHTHRVRDRPCNLKMSFWSFPKENEIIQLISFCQTLLAFLQLFSQEIKQLYRTINRKRQSKH